MKYMTIFKQAGYDLGAAEPFEFVKCLPCGIHIEKPVLTSFTENFFPASGRSV